MNMPRPSQFWVVQNDNCKEQVRSGVLRTKLNAIKSSQVQEQGLVDLSIISPTLSAAWWEEKPLFHNC